MLVRPSKESAFEVLMLRRSASSRFLPHAYVFPGGAVEDEDASAEAQARSIASRSDDSRAKFDHADALLFCGVRELFEEAGVLLACTANGDPASAAQFRHADRAKVLSGRLAFVDFLERAGLYADTKRLVLFSHWITPPELPQRYDAYFFLAEASGDQVAMADTIETHDDVWIAPEEALRRHAQGALHLVYPTIKHLERLTQFETLGSLTEFARTKAIKSIMPESTGESFRIPAELESAW